MSDGIEIEIASGKSTIRNSPIKIGDISGGDLTKIEVGKGDTLDSLTQRILDELSDAKQRIRTIEQYIGGSQLGEPGLTIQVKDLKADIRRIEKEVEFAAALDARIANMEALLISYTRNNVSIDKWVFLAVVGLLFLAIPAVFLILWLGRGGGL